MQRNEVQSIAVARPGQVVVNCRGIGVAVEDCDDHGHVTSLGWCERFLAKYVYRNRPGHTAGATTIKKAVDFHAFRRENVIDVTPGPPCSVNQSRSSSP